MEYDRYRQIPNALRKCREAKGLSQTIAAKHLGFKDKTWISHWEGGDALPNLVSLIRLAVLYETTIEELFPGLMNVIREEQPEKRIGVDAALKTLDARETSGTLATHDAR